MWPTPEHIDHDPVPNTAGELLGVVRRCKRRPLRCDQVAVVRRVEDAVRAWLQQIPLQERTRQAVCLP